MVHNLDVCQTARHVPRVCFHHANLSQIGSYILYYTTVELQEKKKVYTPWNSSHFSWAKRVGCTSNFVRLWVVVGDVYGRHSGNQCAAGAGWLDRYYDYGCLVEIQKKNTRVGRRVSFWNQGHQNDYVSPHQFEGSYYMWNVAMSSVAGNCESPRTVCGWEKCGLSTSQLAAIVFQLLCLCVCVRESRWKRLVVVSSVSW